MTPYYRRYSLEDDPVPEECRKATAILVPPLVILLKFSDERKIDFLEIPHSIASTR